MAQISDEERKKIIISIVITNTKTGCDLKMLKCEFNSYYQSAAHAHTHTHNLQLIRIDAFFINTFVHCGFCCFVH